MSFPPSWPKLLVLCLAPALLLHAEEEEEDRPLQADMTKLLGKETQEKEVLRLVNPENENVGLAHYSLHWCKQAANKRPLLLVLANTYDLPDNKYPELTDPSEYTIDKPEELFPPQSTPAGKQESPPSYGPAPTTPEIIESRQLLVFDESGKELRPWDEDNYISRGYVHDFNGDGITERANSTAYSVKAAEDDDIEVFELLTIERKPRTLLRVIYNWHHEDADDSCEWTFSCEDIDRDGKMDIAFGPRNATTSEEKRTCIYQWSETQKRYVLTKSPDPSQGKLHVLAIDAEQSLDSIAAQGGLGYPIKTSEKIKGPLAEENLPVIQPPYQFRSLKDSSDADLLNFYRSKARLGDDFADARANPNTLPPSFWSLPAKQAALQLAEANRNDEHRKQYRLAIDDRNNIQPPAEGWLTCDWSSSGCYSLSTKNFALHFGSPNPWLLVTESNSHGFVGRDPLIDRPAYRVRIISLEPEEARFLADVTFWLDRIRCAPMEDSRVLVHSTADGHSRIFLHPLNLSHPRELASETVWSDTIRRRWTGGYGKETFANLTTWLWSEALPLRFKNQWDTMKQLDHRSLITPLEERLQERNGRNERKQLEAAITEAFQRNEQTPLPPSILTDLISCSSTERMISLQPAVARIHASLRPETAEEREWKSLKEQRFKQGGHFDLDSLSKEETPKEQKERKRLELLDKKFEFDHSAQLREYIKYAEEKFALMANPDKLLKAAQGNGDHSAWAMQTLQQQAPEVYAEILIEDIGKQAAVEERRRLFETLAQVSPTAALRLRDRCSDAQQNDLLLEITALERKHAPEEAAKRIPALFALIENRHGELFRRCKAMDTLPDMPLDAEACTKLEALLSHELEFPQKGQHESSSVHSAFCALARMPNAAAYLPQLKRTPTSLYLSFDTSLESLAHASSSLPDQKKQLEDVLRSSLKKSSGFMDRVFQEILAYDLRGLAPDIEAFATVDAKVPDGDGSNYSGGRFNGPAGHRYHAAREVAALWREEDSTTRARMWIAMILTRYQSTMDPEYSSASNQKLLSLASEAILSIPRDDRANMINSLISTAALPESQDCVIWLHALRDKP